MAKLRAMAEHVRSDPREAAVAREELERMGRSIATSTPRRAELRIEGNWLMISVADVDFDFAKSIVTDVMGICGRIGPDLAIYSSDVEDRDYLADALTCYGFAVSIASARRVLS